MNFAIIVTRKRIEDIKDKVRLGLLERRAIVTKNTILTAHDEWYFFVSEILNVDSMKDILFHRIYYDSAIKKETFEQLIQQSCPFNVELVKLEI